MNLKRVQHHSSYQSSLLQWRPAKTGRRGNARGVPHEVPPASWPAAARIDAATVGVYAVHRSSDYSTFFVVDFFPLPMA